MYITEAFDQTGQVLNCNEKSVYLYPDFEFESSLVTEQDLVCSEEFKVRRILQILDY